MKKILHTFCVILLFLSFCLIPNNSIGQSSSGLTLDLKGASISEIYPNPAEQVAHFDYILSSSEQKATVEIFNLIGVVVWHQDLPSASGTVSLTLTDFKRGVYFYRLAVGNEKTSIRKLIVR